MKRPSLGAMLLALIPFVAMCFSVPLWDRVAPMLLGIPFNLFWLISWIVLSTASWPIPRTGEPEEPCPPSEAG